MNIQERLKEVMGRSGTTYEQLDLISGEQMKKKLLDYTNQHFFLKSYQEVVKENVTIKEDVFSTVFGLDACPFEHLTQMNWEKMFKAAVAFSTEINHSYKMMNGWFHMITSSECYIEPNYVIRSHDALGDSITLKFLTTGHEFVDIGGKQFMYGEQKIYFDKLPYTKYDFHLTYNHPTIVIDARLISDLKKQVNYQDVMKMAHVLYHVTSHDGLLHSVFMEVDKQVRERIQQHLFLQGMVRQYYFCYDQFEVAYARFMKQVFELAISNNSQLLLEVLELMETIESITADWEKTIGDYVRFIAKERIARILPTEPPTFVKYVGCTAADGKYVVSPAGTYLDEAIHTLPGCHAIMDMDNKNSKEIKWPQLTKQMFFLQTMYN